MIAVRSLGYAYPKAASIALHGLDLQIGQGGILVLAGPAGAGKSTFQKILVGLLRDYSGTVEFLGKELKEWSRDFYERIGACPQAPAFFLKLTALENLAYAARLYSGSRGMEPVPALLDQVGLSPDAAKPVGGYTPEMKTRLGLARALLHRPEALFLDEPLAGLDPGNASQIKELIRSQGRAGRTVLLTTRDISLADELGDRVAFLSEGRILPRTSRGPV
jgi:fluoroquinolone transport system ATP-binding protein